jgi:hypothetical protein
MEAMSDFGSMVIIHRSDGTSTTDDDQALVTRIAKALVFGDPNRMSDYADFDLRFGGSRKSDGSHGINVGLT